ncbi:hypothetical protein VT84_03345 [Gemmata sp. SH-PL17]|uniref:DUF3168 domain-containing protein n=1 Tax=Gemmata sp. SH-PL17 TaxID=1630693 RepID=UPI00078BD1FE|nr:DUF3168 domain-containing protein [Gemmata sp. SH-PL17]AMV23418.1 hypothetical protein VT84_03345 [Gemmata sp. SH-PL17]
MAAATAEIAVVAKLKAGATAAEDRVNPQVNTSEPVLPFITVTRQGVQPRSGLDGRTRALLAVTIGVECYATTQKRARELSTQVRALLAPENGPWRDLDNGVQGCFWQDCTEEIADDAAQDTPRLWRDTYLVWHFPT